MDPKRADDKPRSDLAVALRQLRALRGWHQADFAAAAEIDVRTLQRYEAGDLEVPEEAQERLVRAAGLPATLFEHVLLPAVRVLRAGLEREEDEDEGPEETLEEAAARVGKEIAETVRITVLEHYVALEREEREREENAWRPKPADREAVPDLLARLARYDEATRDFLIEEARPFQSWALAEQLAHSATEGAADAAGAAQALGGATDRARLAVRVASKVPGPEGWRARLEGYAQAFLAGALRQAGVEQAAQGAEVEAERLWAAGVDEAGVLDEERFCAAMWAAKPRRL